MPRRGKGATTLSCLKHKTTVCDQCLRLNMWNQHPQLYDHLLLTQKQRRRSLACLAVVYRSNSFVTPVGARCCKRVTRVLWGFRTKHAAFAAGHNTYRRAITYWIFFLVLITYCSGAHIRIPRLPKRQWPQQKHRQEATRLDRRRKLANEDYECSPDVTWCCRRSKFLQSSIANSWSGSRPSWTCSLKWSCWSLPSFTSWLCMFSA